MKKRLLLLLFVVTFLPVFTLFADDRAYFTTDKTTIKIGEPIQLLLHLRVPQDAQISVPDFETILSPFVVETIGSLNLAQQFDDGSAEYQLPLVVILWRTGTYETPSIIISYQHPAGKLVNLSVESLKVEVASTLNDDDLSLRPFKPLANLPYFPVWEILLAVFIVTGVVLIVSRKAMRTKQNAQAASFSGHPDAVYTLKILHQIEQSVEMPGAIYIQVADCLRGYLSNRYSIPALDLTTTELVDELNEKGILVGEPRRILSEMLKRADLVKFAGVAPKQNAAKQYISSAMQWVQMFEQAKVGQDL